MIGRRAFLTWSAAGLAALGLPALPSLARWSRGVPLAATAAEASEAALGKICGAALSGPVQRQLLHRLAELAPDASLEALRRQDFETEQTIAIDGWICSKTEVGLWLMRAQSRAQHGPRE